MSDKDELITLIAHGLANRGKLPADRLPIMAAGVALSALLRAERAAGRAEGLREAADDWEDTDVVAVPDLEDFAAWLRDRADAVEQGEEGRDA